MKDCKIVVKEREHDLKKSIKFLFEEKLHHIRNFNTTNKNYTTIIFLKARYFFNKFIITFKLFDPRDVASYLKKCSKSRYKDYRDP